MNKSYLIIGAADSNHVKKWAGGMKTKGYDVSLFSFYPPTSGWYQEKNITVFSYFKNNSRQRFKKFLYIFAAIPLRKILRNKYDIVNAHYASSYGFVSILAGAKNLITSYWGTDIFVFPKKNFITKSITKYVLKKSTYLLSSSHVMAAEINKYSDRKVEVISFGIDLKVFTPNDVITGINQKRPIKIGIVKTLLPIYRIDIAIEAVKLLSKYDDVELHICGEGVLFNSLKEIATESVHFRGSIPNSDVPDFIKSMDIMLNPTDFESFGVSIIESMACGTPVIAHNSGGASEIISDNNTGILYKPNDSSILKSKIETLIEDEQLYASIAKNARLNVEGKYNFQQNLDDFILMTTKNK